MKKITIVGDIMCEPLLIKAAGKKEGYDFHGVFSQIQDLFSEADYVIGNLETPLAGKEAGYTTGLFSFNTPDEFADAIKDAGIDLVTTANNHCLDRGIEGLCRTLQILKKKNLQFTGTCLPEDKRQEAAYFQLGSARIAVISYTYGTNYAANHVLLDDTQHDMVNLLRPQKEKYFISKKVKDRSVKERAFRKFLSFFSEEKRYYIKKALHKPYNSPHSDDSLNKETMAPYLEQLLNDIKTAKQNADIVIFFPHTGGQFNLEPGIFSEYLFDQSINAGCDAVIASHPHIVQYAEQRSGAPCFFSLGNFSMSPNSVYLLHENLPDYGLAAHLYINDSKIDKVSFSILKMIEEKSDMLTVFPIDKYAAMVKNDGKRFEKLKQDVCQIYSAVTRLALTGEIIKKEYDLPHM